MERNNKEVKSGNGIIFYITDDQVETLRNLFDITKELEDYEVCELLDALIDKHVQ